MRTAQQLNVIIRLGLGSTSVLLMLVAAPGWLALQAFAADSAETIVWSIGTADGSSIEFAPGLKKELTYRVGTSVPSRDFAGHHAGSVGFDPSASGEKAYSIQFDLEPIPGVYGPEDALKPDAPIVQGEDNIVGKQGDVVKVPLKKVHTAITKDEGATILVFRVHEQGQPERVPVEGN